MKWSLFLSLSPVNLTRSSHLTSLWDLFYYPRNPRELLPPMVKSSASISTSGLQEKWEAWEVRGRATLGDNIRVWRWFCAPKLDVETSLEKWLSLLVPPAVSAMIYRWTRRRALRRCSVWLREGLPTARSRKGKRWVRRASVITSSSFPRFIQEGDACCYIP